MANRLDLRVYRHKLNLDLIIDKYNWLWERKIGLL